MGDTQNQDYLNELVTNGKVGISPYQVYPTVVESTLDFDKLFDTLRNSLVNIFRFDNRICAKYGCDVGLSKELDEIAKDLDQMLGFALMCLYNRLRAIAKIYVPNKLGTSRFVHKAPCSAHMEFPAYLSSLLESIGPLRVPYARSKNLIIIYVPLEPHGMSKTYGRKEYYDLNIGRYERLIDAIRFAKMETSPISRSVNLSTVGSFWTTCRLERVNDSINILGNMPRHHYENEDVVRASFLSPEPDENPFLESQETSDFPITCYLSQMLYPDDIHDLLYERFKISC